MFSAPGVQIDEKTRDLSDPAEAFDTEDDGAVFPCSSNTGAVEYLYRDLDINIYIYK